MRGATVSDGTVIALSVSLVLTLAIHPSPAAQGHTLDTSVRARTIRMMPLPTRHVAAAANDDTLTGHSEHYSKDDFEMRPIDDLTESEALLAPELTTSSLSPTRHSSRTPKFRSRFTINSPTRIVYLACVLSALLDFSTFLNMAPQTDVIERIICRNYYDAAQDHDLLSLDCKLEPIQTELAKVQEWRASLGQLPGILLALAYGSLADQRGRRFVFTLFMVGLLLSDVWVKVIYLFPDVFPIRGVLAAPIIQFIGGGGQVGDFVVCTVIADVVPAQDRVRALLKLTAMDLIAQIVAIPIAAALMSHSSWYPMLLSSFFLVMITFLGLALPETRPTSCLPLSARSHGDGNDDEGHGLSDSVMGNGYKRFFGSLRSMSTLPVLMLLFVFVLACFGAQALQLLLQYATKKFTWTYGQASFLVTLRSSAHLLLATVLMPLLDTYITRRRGIRAGQKDMILSQLSCLFLVVGHLGLFLANDVVALCFGIITVAFGSSFLIGLRSTMTALVPATSVSALYTAISIAHGLGVMLSGPLCAAIYHAGMILGDAWLGLPFAVTSAVQLLGMVIMATAFRSSRVMD